MTTTAPDALEVEGVAVALVAWPVGEARRRTLAVAGRPRLLLVAADAAPPVVEDRLEDWVQLSRDFDDIARRARRLARLASAGA